MQDQANEQQAPRTYAVCVYCKKRSTNRALFTIDPYFPQAGVTYRCADLAACGDRGRERDAQLAEKRQARREAAEAAVSEPEPYRIDGLAACGAPVDGGRCGRAPGHNGHPHIQAPESQPEPVADDRCSACHRDAHRPGTGWQGHHYSAPESQSAPCVCGIPNRAAWHTLVILGREDETTYTDIYS